MPSFRAFGSLLLLFASIPACQGANSETAEVPLSDLVEKSDEASCEYAVRCGMFPDVQACVGARGTTTNVLIAGVNAGRIAYDGQAAAECFAIVRALGCNSTDTPEQSPPACERTFKGTLSAGASCTMNEDCLSGSCASISCSSPDGCCTGTCDPPEPAPTVIAVGGDCSDRNTTCVEGARCAYTTSPAPCVDGAPCANTTSAATCFLPPALGEDCNPVGLSGERCQGRLVCVDSPSPLGGTCAFPPAEGEACAPSAGTSPAACNSSRDYCDGPTSVCLRKIAVGMSCPSGEGCVDYAYCDPSTLICIAKGCAGEACDDHDYSGCMGSLVCSLGTCVLPPQAPVCPL